MKKLWPVMLVVAAGAAWMTRAHWMGGAQGDEFAYASVGVGPLRMTVQTTGPLKPVRTVPVGSEVSGTVAMLGADFNDRVKKGQVLARLNTDLFDSRLAQARANCANAKAGAKKAELALAELKTRLPLQTRLAKANLDLSQAAMDIAEYNWNRVEDLYKKNNAPENEWRARKAEFETAKANLERARVGVDQAKLDETTRVDQADQDVKLAEAAGDQAKASLDLAQQDLDRCTIKSPIDGFVLKRMVNVGEPVISALTAQYVFIVTPDLGHMQLYANVGESDIALVKSNQPAEFTVDACGERRFGGTVTMVRNDPVTIQGVVTYQVLIDVENPDGVLKPEMTANVSIEVVKREGVTKIDNSALRFKPEEIAKLQNTIDAIKWPELKVDGGRVPLWASKTLLWAEERGQWKPMPVWIGITDNRATEILMGASPGQKFVTSVTRRGGIGTSMKQAMEMANPGNRSL